MNGAELGIVEREQTACHLLLGMAALHGQEHAQGVSVLQAAKGQGAQAGELVVAENPEKLSAVSRDAKRHLPGEQGRERAVLIRVGQHFAAEEEQVADLKQKQALQMGNIA